MKILAKKSLAVLLAVMLASTLFVTAFAVTENSEEITWFDMDIDYKTNEVFIIYFVVEGYSVLNEDAFACSIFDSNDNLVDGDIIAVNDFNIARHGYARMIRLDIFINDQLAERFDADGVLVSSPTGSTAYSLSAGGPIILPGIDCILITPVCPHTLHARPMITPENVKIKIIAKDLLHDVITTVDGQSFITVPAMGSIEITKSKYSAKFVRFRKEDYYTRFWKKIINWSIN